MATDRPPTLGTIVPDLASRPKIDWELHTPLNVDIVEIPARAKCGATLHGHYPAVNHFRITTILA